jgi:hypothetical protein
MLLCVRQLRRSCGATLKTSQPAEGHGRWILGLLRLGGLGIGHHGIQNSAGNLLGILLAFAAFA